MIQRLKDLEIKKIKDGILGKDYDLSVVFIDEAKSQALNFKYRKINKPTDVLSFSLSENLGEIFICPKIAKQKSLKFLDPMTDSPITFKNYLRFLVIHGALHLKGLEHGDKMEAYELTHYSQHRHRHL